MSPPHVLRSAVRTAARRPPAAIESLPRPYRDRLFAAGLRVAARRPASTDAHARPATVSTHAPSSSKPKSVRLTAESYPSIQRDPRFAQLTAEDVAHLSSICPALSAETGASPDELEPFNTDWMRKYRGQARLVLKPRSTSDVSRILSYCHGRRLAVCPQGGNTGLVGGSVPVFDEIVLALGGLDRIRGFDAAAGILVCDAGVVLERADAFLRERDHIFPLDLGAKGSCHVGGNVATNAGGLRLLRYGSLHGSVLGLEAVLPDGTVLDDLATLRKNNTGYDLKQLFIGSEGTLGVITAVSVLCPQRAAATNVMYLAVESFDQVQRVFARARQQLSEILSAFELMDRGSQAVVAAVTGRKRPLAADAPFYLLIETSGSRKEHDDEKLLALYEGLERDGLVLDGTLAESETQLRELWAWRERIPETLAHWGGVYKYDVSIPLAQLYALVDATRQRMAAAGLLSTPAAADNVVVDVVGYGHMGDANLHLNVPVRGYDPRVERALEPFVYEWVGERRGSVSAEHGLGVAKREYVHYSRGQTELDVMARIKRLFDPNGIMNPYKYIKA